MPSRRSSNQFWRNTFGIVPYVILMLFSFPKPVNLMDSSTPPSDMLYVRHYSGPFNFLFYSNYSNSSFYDFLNLFYFFNLFQFIFLLYCILFFYYIVFYFILFCFIFTF